MTDSFRRAFHVDCRILSAKDGTVEYIASDATLDSYNEVVLATGWKFNLFEKNAPFVDSHNYWSIESLLGKVQTARLEGSQLIERVKWAKDIPEAKLAVLGWKLTEGQFLKAVSVGFKAVKSVYPKESGWNGYVQQAGLSPEDAAKCRRIFVEQEQLELSACILGANPSAVAKAFDEGCINDADLAGIGFTDSDMQFLSTAAKALAAGTNTDLTLKLIEGGMGVITARQNNLRNPKKSTNSPSSGKPGGDETARRQAEEKEAEFLRKLDAIIKG